jgi:NAD(P)H-hydrate repair Nnr-like enzyme with NAD(P)H-hydrate dehydratase domain
MRNDLLIKQALVKAANLIDKLATENQLLREQLKKEAEKSEQYKLARKVSEVLVKKGMKAPDEITEEFIDRLANDKKLVKLAEALTLIGKTNDSLWSSSDEYVSGVTAEAKRDAWLLGEEIE